MPGELYLGEFRVGVETVYGTPVAPTRRLYLRQGSGVNPGGDTTRHSFLTGGREQVLSATPGAAAPAGTFSLPVSSDEVLELLSMGINGTPTITTPGGTTPRLHVYVPGTLKSGTLQVHDGALPWQWEGVLVNTMRLAGNPRADGENVISGDFFAEAGTQTALSGTATARTPRHFGGWEARLYIDPVSGTDNYGTTLIAHAQSVAEWDVPLCENNLGRKYLAGNTQNMQAAITGTFEATGSLTFEASGAQALTEYNAYVAGTLRRVRLRFGDNAKDQIETTYNHFLDWDCQLVWTSMNLLAEDAGTRVYAATFGYVRDTTNGFGLRVRSQNARTAAF